jgi:hypothetical protein
MFCHGIEGTLTACHVPDSGSDVQNSKLARIRARDDKRRLRQF